MKRSASKGSITAQDKAQEAFPSKSMVQRSNQKTLTAKKTVLLNDRELEQMTDSLLGRSLRKDSQTSITGSEKSAKLSQRSA